jgi:hypothetical protein
MLPSNSLLRPSGSSDSSQTDAATIIKTVREFNLEGAIAKRRSSFYEPGKRTGAWIGAFFNAKAGLMCALPVDPALWRRLMSLQP